MPDKTIAVARREVPIGAVTDVAVAGGGPSGLAAAITAAKKGLSVILIERYGFFGGLATAGSVGTICGLYLHHPDRIERIIEGFAGQLEDALVKRGGGFGPFIRQGFTALLYNPWHLKRLCDEWIGREKNIRPMLHSYVADAVHEDGQIKALLVASPEGLFAVRAGVYIDATGDAAVAMAAGVKTEKGDARGMVMNPTMMFYVQGLDLVGYQAKGMAVLNDRIRQAIAKKTYPLTVGQGLVIPTFRQGEAMIKLSSLAREGRALDGSSVSDLTYAELKGRDDAEIAMDFLKHEIPGFENAFLADTAVQVGVRETRRIIGHYILTEQDVLSGKKFPDTICLSSWPLEKWEDGREPEMVFPAEGDYYGIPYRSLLPVGTQNLLVTGRAISMDHGALASARVMGVCMAEGQAAGTACVLAARRGVKPSEIDTEQLQLELKKDGARLD
ncbi:MAG: FAD-dependent oxidoreductase [Deltaproteobacteria bacterium]|nr:FAD-dependent oxidoreductase [Candidatus Zymogenaceae bacterium]